MKRFSRILLRVLFLALVFAAGMALPWLNRHWTTWTDGVGISRSGAAAELRYLLWENPKPLALGLNVTNHIEPVISVDGRLMVFAAGKAGYNADLYWSERQGDEWSAPKPMDAVNSPSDELGPALNRAGDVMWFYSNREGGHGGYDIWRSRLRYGQWEPPEVLGVHINSLHDEYDPTPDAGDRRLAFASNRPRDPAAAVSGEAWKGTLRERVSRASFDLYLADRVDPASSNLYSFAEAAAWDELNSAADEGQPAFSPHGDFVYFSSNREGGAGGFDLYRLRLSPPDPAGPQALPRPVNSAADEMDPALWHEGHSLVFSSNLGQKHPLDFALWTTTSREVIGRPWLTWGALRALVDAYGLWALLLLLALLGGWWLWRMLYGPNAVLGNRARALAFSGLAHALLLFLLSLWFLASAVVDETAGPMELAVSETALAREKLALALREDVADLQLPETPPLVDQVRLSPDLQPPDLPEALRVDMPPPAPSEFAPQNLPALAETAPSDLPEQPLSPPELPDLPSTLPPMEVAEVTEWMEPTPVSASAAPSKAEAEPVLAGRPGERGQTSSQVTVSSAVERVEIDLASLVPPGAGLRPQTEAAVLKRGDGPPLPELPLALAGDMDTPALPAFEPALALVLEEAPVTTLSYYLRDPAHRLDLIEQLGGSDETEAAIALALEFFVRAQEADGHWDIQRWGGEGGHNPAATGLAMLCFMGHGATHVADTPFKDTMAKATAWLVGQQQESGRFSGKDMYDHCIATIALAEAYAMSKDAGLRGPLEKAIAFLIQAQHGAGGWRYQPKESGDMSVFGWALMALSSARQSGIDIPDAVFRSSETWLDSVSAGRNGGRYGYDNRNASRRAMTSEGLFCRQLLHTPRERADMQESVAFLATELPQAGNPDFYHWYYGTLGLFQHQGEVWDQWNTRMRRILVDGQVKQGEHAGSWDAKGPNSERMGRIVSTAMATLSLEVYYRYLPMYSGQYSGKPVP